MDVEGIGILCFGLGAVFGLFIYHVLWIWIELVDKSCDAKLMSYQERCFRNGYFPSVLKDAIADKDESAVWGEDINS